MTSVYKSRLPLSPFCSVPQVNVLGGFNGQLNTPTIIWEENLNLGSIKNHHCLWVSVFRRGILIVTWCGKTQPTVGNPIPWSGDAELYKKALAYKPACLPASKHSPPLFLPYFDCEVSSSVRGGSLWRSKCACLKILGFRSCVDFLQEQAVAWNYSTNPFSQKVILGQGICHNNKNKTRTGNKFDFFLIKKK